MPRRVTGQPAGRPAHDPIVLRPPKVLPLDDETRHAVVRILVELLDDWLRSKKPTARKAAV